MDELRAEFDGDGQPRIVMCPDPATDPVPRFEHDHAEAVRDQLSRSGDAGHTGTDHDDVETVQFTFGGRSQVAMVMAPKYVSPRPRPPSPRWVRPRSRASGAGNSDR